MTGLEETFDRPLYSFDTGARDAADHPLAAASGKTGDRVADRRFDRNVRADSPAGVAEGDAEPARQVGPFHGLFCAHDALLYCDARATSVDTVRFGRRTGDRLRVLG